MCVVSCNLNLIVNKFCISGITFVESCLYIRYWLYYWLIFLKIITSHSSNPDSVPNQVPLKENNLFINWLRLWLMELWSQMLHFDLFNALSPRLHPSVLNICLLVCKCVLLSTSRSLESLLARIRLTCVLGCHLDSRPVKACYIWFARRCV